MNFSNEKVIGQVIDISNDDILPNRFQPRKYFDEVETLELADSIKEHGILQPIVVRQVGDKYEIIAGERRFKANILAGNDSIPAIINNFDDKASSEIAVIENIQRQNLTPIEEAISYKRIIDMGYLTQEELARKIGKSQSAIANKIRLLKLSDNVQDALMSKKISERHARSLLKLDSLKKQDELLDKIISERLTVRKTDEEIRKMNNEFINNNMQNNLGESGMNPTFMNVPTPQPNIFGDSNVSVDNSQDVEIPVSNVSPIMGSPVQSDVQQQPIVNNNIIENNDDSNGMTQSIFTSTNIDSPVSASNSTFDNNVINPFSMNINNNMNQSIENSNYVKKMDEPMINPTSINEPVQPINNIDQTPNNLYNNNEMSLNIFGSNPVISDTPVVNSQQPTESNINIDSPINNFNVPITPVEPVSNVQPAEPTTNYSIPSVEPTIQTPIDNNPFVSQPVQDQPLSSTPVSQFNIPSVDNISPETNIDQVTTPVNDFSYQNNEIDNNTPSFIPEQPVENINTPVVDLSQNIQPTPINNDIPLNNSISTPINNDIPLNNSISTPVSNVNEPIIVSNDDNQFDPIMPETQNNEPTLDFKTIINLVRQCSQTIEKCGYRIDVDEVDMGDKYQVTFTIDK